MADVLGQRLGYPAFTGGAGIDTLKHRHCRRCYFEVLGAAGG